MKKFFSLVLALVMALSLTTVAWGADVTFTVDSSNPFSATNFHTLQDAVDAAAAGNTTTIKLLAACDEDIIVTQKEGVDVVIDGNDNTFTGTIEIYGQARHTGAETLTIQNINFTTDKQTLSFIHCNTTDSAKRYAHNVTIQDCTFTATAANNSVVATRFRQCYNIQMINCDVDGLHSAMQATGVTGLVVDKLTATNLVEGGLNLNTSTSVAVKNSAIESDSANGYGIRADGSVETTLTVENCEVEAFVPVVVRNTSKAYTVELSGNNDLTATNTDGYEVAFAKGDYKADGTLVQPDVSYTLKNTGTPVQTSQVGFVVNGTNYDTLTAAVAAAADGDTVVMMANSAEDITDVDKALTIDVNGYAFTGTVTADTGYQVVKTTTGDYVVAAAVTMGDKFDLYLADKNMNTMLALEKPTVSGLTFDEKGAKANQDGSGNVAYIVANNGDYYVKTTTPTTDSYAVTYTGKTTVLYYVDVVDAANTNVFEYTASVKEFTNFGLKCGQLNVTPAADDIYFQTAAGVIYKAATTVGTDVSKNYLLDGEVVTAADAGQKAIDHSFSATNFQYDAVKKVNVPTEATCTKCLAQTSSIYLDGKVPATYTRYPLTNGGKYVVGLANPAAVAPVVPTTPSTDKVQSAETFDAGIAMYVGMSVMAAAGSVVVLKKRED